MTDERDEPIAELIRKRDELEDRLAQDAAGLDRARQALFAAYERLEAP